MSTATGILNTAAQLGTALGVAALVLVASAGRPDDSAGTVHATMLAAAIAVVSLLAISRWRTAS